MLHKLSVERVRQHSQDIFVQDRADKRGPLFKQNIDPSACDGGTLHEKTRALAKQFLQKSDVANSAVQRIVDDAKIAKVAVNKHSIEQQKQIDLAKKKERDKDPLMANIMKVRYEQQDQEEKAANKIADGFVRSKRNVALRVRNNIEIQMHELEDTKNELVQRLNAALLKLDTVNSANREENNRLVSKIKFVRDLQKASSAGEDVDSIISVQLKEEFQRLQRMNVQLKQELKRCEVERLQIIERLHCLVGSRDNVSCATEGSRKTFKVTAIGIGQMRVDIENFKRQIDSTMLAISQQEHIVSNLQRDLDFFGQQNFVLENETNCLRDKTQQMIDRLDEATRALEGEKHRVAELNKLQVKLIACRQMEESMQKLLARNVEQHFDQVLCFVDSNHKQFGAVWKFRNVLLAKSQTALRRALYKWHKVACNLTEVIALNRAIPLFYNKRHQKSHFYNRWLHEYLQRKVEQRYVSSNIVTLNNCYYKFRLRLIQGYFQRWRDNLIDRNMALKRMFRFFKKVRIAYEQQAFTRWHTYKLGQDFTIRMRGLAIEIAWKKNLASIFAELRHYASQRRTRHKFLKARVVRIWKVYIARRKQHALATLGLLGTQKSIREYYKQLCFNAMRKYLYNSQLATAVLSLKSSEQPKIAKLTRQMEKLALKMKLQAKQRAVNAFAVLFGKQLGVYWTRWKQQALMKTRALSVEFRRKLVKLYLEKLTLAFGRWRDGRRRKIIALQTIQIEELQSGSVQLEVANRQTAALIKTRDESTKSLASKRLRKLMTTVFQSHVRHFLYRWQENTQLKERQQDGAARILKKMRLKVVRLAFNRYKRGSDLATLDIKIAARVVEVKQRLAFRAKKRIFGAIKNFSGNHHNATAFLKALIKHMGGKYTRIAFNSWRNCVSVAVADEQFEQQSKIVAVLVDLSKDQSEVCDTLNSLQTDIARKSKALKTEAKKTLEKWADRFKIGSLSWGLHVWKMQNARLRHRAMILTKTKTHLKRTAAFNCLTHWRMVLYAEKKLQILESAHQEDDAKRVAEFELQSTRSKKAAVKVDLTKRTEAQAAETEYTKAKTVNTIKLLLQISEQNHRMKFKKYLLLSWHHIAQRRKKCCSILVNAINKTLLKDTFTELNEFKRDVDYTRAVKSHSKRLFQLYRKFRIKRAIHSWRECQFKQTTSTIAELSKETNVLLRTQSYLLERVKRHHNKVQTKRNGQIHLQKVFDEMRKFSHERRKLRLSEVDSSQALVNYARKRALLKWKARMHFTKKMRQVVRKVKKAKKLIDQRRVLKAWRNEHLITRYFASRLINTIQSLLFSRKEMALTQLRLRAIQKEPRVMRRQMREMGKIVQLILVSKVTRILRRYWMKWSVTAEKQLQLLSKMGKFIVLSGGQKLRSFFQRWVDQAQKEACLQFNEFEDGPVNCQLWNLKRSELHLEKFLREEDRQPQEEVDRLKADAQGKYTFLMEKSLCRLLCNQDRRKLYVMPIFLDRWRNFVRVRKQWRRVLNTANHRVGKSNLHEKQWAFKKLKFQHRNAVTLLKRQPAAQLMNRCVANVNRLQELAEVLNSNSSAVDEFTVQRDTLLRSFIGSQKLALSASNHSFERVKFKALHRLMDSGQRTLTSQIESALASNLDKISELKDVIGQLENDNTRIARENDDLRRGAMDGIELARQLEFLNFERQKLSLDLADKAVTIKKLLEDNIYLTTRLQQAQMLNRTLDAQRMDKNSQVKFESELEGQRKAVRGLPKNNKESI